MASRIENLVVNGCSYAESYVQGQGAKDLAQRLGISASSSLALSGSSNSRILRTTAKHAYINTVPTLYVLGLTFMARWELPIAENRANQDFEGRWINPQAQYGEQRQWNWTDQDTKKYVESNFKAVVLAHDDMFEDLFYRCLTLKDYLKPRGHRVLFFNYCNVEAENLPTDSKFLWLKNHPEIVEKFKWIATPWQHQMGVEAIKYPAEVKQLPPPELYHRVPGQHNLINEFLTNYLQEHRILE